ncbi:MAG: ParB/RepB/Spo0J family partition protein [Candidatus Omnitrophota bacterium]|nr:MAG: ParB/RepB/Spo0J family partition protein [Candidatus Omnitrophota bacterium]
MQKKVLGRGLSALMPEKPVKPGANVVTVDINKISFSPFQPRQERNPQKAQELMASIKEKGVIQPVVVRPKGDGYELIAGERRMRAAKELGFAQLPVVIRDAEDAEALQLALIENIQREELNPLEEAQAYEQLILKFGFTQEKIAQLVGKNPSSISNTLRLLKLPEEIKLALRKGTISMGHARTILGLKSLPEQDRVFRRTVTQQLSVRELENLVTKKVGGTGHKKQLTRNPHIVALEEELQRTLGTKVKIVAGRKRGKIILEYYSSNDMERLTKLLKRVK